MVPLLSLGSAELVGEEILPREKAVAVVEVDEVIAADGVGPCSAGFSPSGKAKPPLLASYDGGGAELALSPSLKGNPFGLLTAAATSTGLSGTVVILLPDNFAWSGNISSILFSRFLCNSRSLVNSRSPITVPVLLFLGAGVPSISAGEGTWSTGWVCLGSVPTLPPSGTTLPPLLLLRDLLLPSLLFLLFFPVISPLSGERKTLLGWAGLRGVVSSDSSASSTSSITARARLRRQRELERLAWISWLTALLVGGGGRCSTRPAGNV